VDPQPVTVARHIGGLEWQTGLVPWTFVVEDSFTLTGRGTAVFGQLEGTLKGTGEPADLRVGDVIKHVDRVSLAVARVEGLERLALMLYGVTREEVPPGAVLSEHST
jgi:translation elongation factor EF-Tu-like GTPase